MSSHASILCSLYWTAIDLLCMWCWYFVEERRTSYSVWAWGKINTTQIKAFYFPLFVWLHTHSNSKRTKFFWSCHSLNEIERRWRSKKKNTHETSYQWCSINHECSALSGWYVCTIPLFRWMFSSFLSVYKSNYSCGILFVWIANII